MDQDIIQQPAFVTTVKNETRKSEGSGDSDLEVLLILKRILNKYNIWGISVARNRDQGLATVNTAASLASSER